MKDAGNIFWQSIPKTAIVRDMGSSYTADMGDGTYKLIYWGSQDAHQAQNYLRGRAHRDGRKQQKKTK